MATLRLLILGATGKTGQLVVQQALDAGHQVTAFVRDPSKLKMTDPGLEIVVGDVFSSDSLAAALKDQDAVISTLGTSKSAQQLLLRSTQALVEAASATGLRRVIMMSSFFMAPDVKPGSALKLLTGVFMKSMVTDKGNAERLLRNSNLDWTIVYCAVLTNGPKTGRQRMLREGEVPSLALKISRADAAAFLLSQVTGSAHIRANLTIAGGA